ncbi:MAG TPA: YceH family protein [Terriglobales bacterium]|nr:YceH family protein [Terriglobales bacterium]
MDLIFSPVEIRVLGSLMEKDITTPDYYPLSLNALVNACNQKSNREPVMELDDNSVRDALSSLAEKRLAGPTSSADSRVTKYEHRMQEVFNFTRRETAIICVLLLRGPQTPGELRGRTERMFQFEDLADVQATLQKLMQREPSLVKVLPRQPGTKEARYMHLFSGDIESYEVPAAAPPTQAVSDDRLVHLEGEVSTLRQEVAELRQQIAEMKKVFE